MNKKGNGTNVRLAVIIILLIIMCIVMATILKECARDMENIEKRPTQTPTVTETIEPTVESTIEPTPMVSFTPTHPQTSTPTPLLTPTLEHNTSPGSSVSTHSDYYGKKVIVLTFDDGPHKTVTNKLLDGLKERKVNATFFVSSIGISNSDWDSDKKILNRLVQEGHEIGNHTQSHKKLTSITNEEVKKELSLVNDRVKEMTGYDIKLFRPPTGAYEKRILEVSNLAMVHFTLDTNDWRYLTDSAIKKYAQDNSLSFEDAKEQRVKYVLDAILGNVNDKNILSRELKHGAVILFHDLYDATVDLALSLIDELKDEGYVFLTASQAFMTEGASPVAGEAYKSIWEGYKIVVPEKWKW